MRAATGKDENPLLTPDVLAYIEKVQSGDDTIKLFDVEEECRTIREGIAKSEMESQSAMTHLSGLTDCSLKTFSKVRDWYKRGLNQRVCVLYAAAGDIIKEARAVKSDAEGTIVEYFGIFVQMLKEKDELADKDDIIHLLCMVAKSKDLSDGVVNDQFGVISLLLDQILKVGEAPTSLMKNTGTCLCLLMNKLGDSKWAEPSCQDIFRSVLKQCENPKPKVRQAAREGCTRIVTSLWTLRGARRHPVFSLTGEFCRERMRSHTKSVNEKKLCHLMAFMSEVMHTFKSEYLEDLFNLILSWLTKASNFQILGKTCLDTLFKLFERRPDVDHLPLETHSKLLKALHDCKPNPNNRDCALKWLQLMGETVACLVENTMSSTSDDRWSFIYHVTDFCDAAFKLLAHDGLTDGCHKAAQRVLVGFGRLVAAHDEKGESADKVERCVAKLAGKLEKVLVKPTVVDLAFNYYEICFGKVFTPARVGLVEKAVLPQLSALRNTNIADIYALDSCLGKAIRTFGPEVMVEKLRVTAETVVDRHSWVLPLFLQHVESAPLGHFFACFLPMACRIEQQSEKAQSKELKSEANVLLKQCWSLLKSYCNDPSDLKEALKDDLSCYKKNKNDALVSQFAQNPTETYKGIKPAEFLGRMLMAGDVELKEIIMESLRNLIGTCQDLEPLKNNLGNFLRILCNIYQDFDSGTGNVEVKSQTQLKALETIRKVCRACRYQQVSKHADKTVELMERNRAECEEIADGKKAVQGRLQQECRERDRAQGEIARCQVAKDQVGREAAQRREKEINKRIGETRKELQSLPSLLKQKEAHLLCKYDVLINLVVHLQVEDVEKVCDRLLEAEADGEDAEKTLKISSKDLHLQKKAYRLFEEVCKSTNEGCKEFLMRNHQKIRESFLREEKNDTIFDPSRGPRFACMGQILKLLMESNQVDECKRLVVDMLPGCVQCLKDSKKAQETAFKLLQTCSFVYEDRLEEFFQLLYVGMEDESSVEFCARSIYALGRVTHDHIQNMTCLLLDTTVNKIIAKLSSNTRQVCEAAMSYVFVLFSFGNLTLAKVYGGSILQAMSNWKKENINHFRLKVKKLLTKLVRRLGYNFVENNASEGFKKLLHAIKKEQANEKKKDKKKNNDYSSDEDDFKPSKKEGFDILSDLDSSDGDEEPARKRKKNDLIIDEDEDEITDLLDASSSKLISTSAPKKKSKSSKNSFDKDGKLIIQLDEKEGSDGDDCLKNIGLKKPTKKILKKKKQTRDEGESDDKDDDVRSKMSKMSVGKSTYNHGGKGIRRDVRDGSEYRSRKARGDVKKKNQLQPHAYIPLTQQVLDRRQQKKVQGQYDAILKSSKKGAQMGRKGKKRKHDK